MKTRTIGATLVALALVGFTPALAANAAPPTKTTICHATGSESNPWGLIEVPEPALGAHAGHGDSIPAPVAGCPVPAPVVPPVEVIPPVVVPPVVVVPSTPPVEIPTQTYTPPVLDCQPGTVPGWTNEHGDPTSCVSNNPCPEVEFGQTCPADVVPPGVPPVVTPPAAVVPNVVTPVVDLAPITSLPVTGTDESQIVGGIIVSGLVLAMGIALTVTSAIRRRSALEV